MELTMGLPHFGLVWWVMVLTIMMGIGQQMDSPYLPMLVDLVLHNGTSEALKWSGILGGASAAAGIFGGFLIGVLADKYPGHLVGIVISIAAGLFLLPQAFCTSLPLLFAERMLMVFFVSGLSPIMQSWLSLTTAPEDRGSISDLQPVPERWDGFSDASSEWDRPSSGTHEASLRFRP